MERPYEPTGMTTQKWIDEVPIKRVKLSDLTFHQEQVSIEGLLNAAKGGLPYAGDEYPHIVIHRGIWWVSDGHHRIVVWLIQGLKEGYCRVLNLDASLAQ